MISLWKNPIGKFLMCAETFFLVFMALPPLSIMQTALVGGLLGGCVSAVDLSVDRAMCTQERAA